MIITYDKAGIYFGKVDLAYNDDYLKLGFTLVEVNGEVRPQCMLCLKVLAHSSLKKAKLCRHLEANHEKFVNKILDVFKEKEHQLKRNRIDRPAAWGGVAYSHNKAVRASFSLFLGKLLEKKRLIQRERT